MSDNTCPKCKGKGEDVLLLRCRRCRGRGRINEGREKRGEIAQRSERRLSKTIESRGFESHSLQTGKN